jgi:hypothetical protein
MKIITRLLLLLLIFNVNLFSQGWPKIIKHSSGTEVTIYQPQIESFDKNKQDLNKKLLQEKMETKELRLIISKDRIRQEV